MVVGLVGLVVRSATPERPSTVLMTELSKLTYETHLDSRYSSRGQRRRCLRQIEIGFRYRVSHRPPTTTIILFTLLLGLGIKMALLPFAQLATDDLCGGSSQYHRPDCGGGWQTGSLWIASHCLAPGATGHDSLLPDDYRMRSVPSQSSMVRWLPWDRPISVDCSPIRLLSHLGL